MADPASVLASDRRFSEAVKKGLEKDEFGQRVHGIFRQVCADTVDAGVKPEAVALHLGISNKNLYKLRSQSHGKYPTLIMAWKLLSLGSPVPEAVKVRAVA
ncbi:MAG TPA: hypothetical protein VFF65_11320, partial [Phycisphaerales bacterium]|nr:hypothetical protein [Phycisphaerales bacterium]